MPPTGLDAASCGACHVEQHEAWSRSAHAHGAGSPVFTALVDRARDAWGTAAADRCQACHAPGHGGDAAIGCTACHGAVGNRGVGDGALVVEPEAPVGGPWGDGLAAPHAVRQSGLLADPALCGTCHEVTGPSLLSEPTYSEHQAALALGLAVSCMGCHMPAGTPGPIAVGALMDRPRVGHRFVGLDPPWGAPPSEAEEEAAASRDLVAAALELEVLRISDETVRVVLRNVGAGHAVPTGATFLRDLWVDVEAVDAASPAWPRVIELGARLTRAGQPVALLTEADAVVQRSLAFGQQTAVDVAIPPSVAVVAVLRARAVRQDALEALGLAERAGEVPTLEIARAPAPPAR